MESQKVLFSFVDFMHGMMQMLRKQSVLKANYRHEANSSHRVTLTQASRQ